MVIVQELQPFISMLLSNQSHSWGSLLLATLYKGMHNLLDQLHKKIQGPIWFLKLWAQMHFKDFGPVDFVVDPLPTDSRVLAPQLVATPIEPLETSVLL